MPKPHFYKNLDADNKLTLELDMRSLAERIVEMNYGVNRLLSHLIDVRRERLASQISRYEQAGHHDIAEYCRVTGDELAAGLERLLEAGLV